MEHLPDMAQIYHYTPSDIWMLHAAEFAVLCSRLDHLAKEA